MKCPKCGYIGFEHTDRCRNCGYDFVLAGGVSPAPDLPLRKDELGPFADLDLGAARRTTSEPGAGTRRRYDPDLDPRITPPARGAVPDLPLFDESCADDLPIVPAAAPAPPLAVRRSTPPAVRARPRPTPRAFEMPSDAGLPLSGEMAGENAAAAAPVAPAAGGADATAPALGPRVLAALVDALLLVGVDAVVVYFTLQICRLGPAEVSALPLTPLVLFLVLLDGGYLALLTAAGGQTLGKMAFGLKVIGSDDGPVTVGRSLVRTIALLLSALPAGLGLLPVLVSAGHRGLHDRLADTRVIRVEAS